MNTMRESAKLVPEVPRWERDGSSGPDWPAWLHLLTTELLKPPNYLSGDVAIPAMAIRDLADMVGMLDKVTTYTCVECQRTIRLLTDTSGNVRDRFGRRVCFNCAFWLEMIDCQFNGRPFTTEAWNHYVAAPRTTDIRSAGSYGSESTVVFADGEVLRTNNIWHQGTVPEHLRSRFDRMASLTWGSSLTKGAKLQ